MRGHFDCEFFRFPHFPPHFGPWDSGFGSFGSGRGRPDFDRPGCRSFGPPGFDFHRHHHGPHHHRHRTNSPPPHERTGSSDNDHHRERDELHASPDCHGSPRCRRHGPVRDHGHSENERCNRGYSMGPQSPWNGPHRWGPHHHWPGHDHRGFGPRFCQRDCHSDCHPQCGPRFGHRRPSPYERLAGCRDCEDCRGEARCSGNEETQGPHKRIGKKKNGPCCRNNKDQDATGDTVLMQRIVVERAPTRPQSV